MHRAFIPDDSSCLSNSWSLNVAVSLFLTHLVAVASKRALLCRGSGHIRSRPQDTRAPNGVDIHMAVRVLPLQYRLRLAGTDCGSAVTLCAAIVAASSFPR